MLQRFILLLTCIGSVFLQLPSETRPNRIIYLNVGQGDATLIQIGSVDILIDGGQDDTIVYKLSKYMHPFDRHIDMVIMTHPHYDHLGGLVDVQDRFTIGRYIHFLIEYTSPAYEQYSSQVPQTMEGFLYMGNDYIDLSHSRSHVRTGDLSISSNVIHVANGASLDILYPEVTCVAGKKCRVNALSNSTVNVNNSSIVFVLTTKDQKHLFMGDAEAEVERYVVLSRVDKIRNVDTLKAGHHCSDTSSTNEFLSVVQPDLAICSVSKDNRFGHPSQEVLDRFYSLGIQYLMTSESGDIVVNL